MNKLSSQNNFQASATQSTPELQPNLVKTFFIIKKWLGVEVDINVVSIDDSLPASWNQNDIMELPKDRKY